MAVLGLVLFTGGCGAHFVARGSDLYTDGRFVEAAEVFERTEERLARSSSAEQARFGLYRGATFLKLGDFEHGARGLGYARSVVEHFPEALNDRDRALLAASFTELGRHERAAPSPKQDSAATAQTDSRAAEPANPRP